MNQSSPGLYRGRGRFPRVRSGVAARGIAVGLVVVLGALAESSASAAVVRPAADRSGPACGPAVRHVAGPRSGVPVLFVHGFSGSPGNFRQTRDGRRSLLDTVGGLRRVATYTFNYSDDAHFWVTDAAIGPELARAITCIADRHGRRVIAVAHSMGGLALQFAQAQSIDGRPVADRLREVITIGTPTHGAQLLSFATGAVGDVFDQVTSAVLSECGRPHKRPGRSLCDLLGTTETPAIQAMRPGSAAIAALPPWPRSVSVVPFAADLVVSVAALGFSQDFDLGDFAVSVGSATGDASPGVVPYVTHCSADLFDLADAVDGSACSHAKELANRSIERNVATRVREAVQAELQVHAGSAKRPSSR